MALLLAKSAADQAAADKAIADQTAADQATTFTGTYSQSGNTGKTLGFAANSAITAISPAITPNPTTNTTGWVYSSFAVNSHTSYRPCNRQHYWHFIRYSEHCTFEW